MERRVGQSRGLEGGFLDLPSTWVITLSSGCVDDVPKQALGIARWDAERIMRRYGAPARDSGEGDTQVTHSPGPIERGPFVGSSGASHLTGVVDERQSRMERGAFGDAGWGRGAGGLGAGMGMGQWVERREGDADGEMEVDAREEG